MKEKFYQKTWFMWLMLIFFAPVGIFLLWKYNRYKKVPRIIITVLFSYVFIFGIFASDDTPKQAPNSNEIVVEESNIENSNSNVEVKKQKIDKIQDEETVSIGKKEETADEIDLTNNDTRELFEGYTLIEVDGGDLSGARQANVVVDVGFGNREYYAFTNQYSQLVKVVAKEIILQDDSTEPVTSQGRYYPDEAKVPGVESSTLDEGHVIADSLGGVSNAYNITPQNSTLNRHGNQAYMEKVIRDAGGCTDFVAIITYPDTKTQIPSHYSYTYTLKGNVIHDEFDNVNPDDANANLNKNSSNNDTATDNTEISKTETLSEGTVKIINLDKKDELIVIKNVSSSDVNLTGWRIVSVKGNQQFTFPSFVLQANSSVTVASGDKAGDLKWGKGNIWNNSKSDPAELYNSNGQLVDRFDN